MKKLFALLTFLSISGAVFAEDIVTQVIGPFGGLNDAENPISIEANKSQDLLNVDITPGGRSVKRRKGYGEAFNLSNSSCAGHGAHYFYDSSGNDVALFFNDSYVYASVNGAAKSVLSSTQPAGATYHCVDGEGYAYCVNSNRSKLFKTNGTTVYDIQTVASTGTLLAITPERLAMSGFAAAPNRIDFSQANDFTSWTPGGYSYSPVNFTITAPGGRITHLVYAHERVYWFKNTSFGYIIDGPELADWTIRTVSPNVGTNDNTSVYWNGILYFRGNDSHIYAYDGSNLSKLSDDISGTIESIQSRTSGAWEQTEYDQFLIGTSSTDISLTISTNSIVAKTTYYSPTISTTSLNIFNNSDYRNHYIDTTTVSNAISTRWPESFDTFKDGTNGTEAAWYKGTECSGHQTYFVSGGSLTMNCVSASDNFGLKSNYGTANLNHGVTVYFDITEASSSIIGLGFGITNNPSWDGYTTEDALYYGNTSVTIEIKGYVGSSSVVSTTVAGVIPTTGTYQMAISTNYVSVTRNDVALISSTQSYTTTYSTGYPFIQMYNIGGTNGGIKINQIAVIPQTFIASSTVLDTGIVLPKWSTYTATIGGTLIDSDNKISATASVSSDNSTYDTAVAITTGSAMAAAPKRYIYNTFTFNQVNSSGTPLYLSNYHFSAGSSGTWISSIGTHTARTQWSNMGQTLSQNDGSITLYTRSSGTLFTPLAEDLSWTLTPVGSVPTIIATNPYVQIKADFVARSSGTVKLDDVTLNWYEGAAEDKSYASHHDDAIWWSVTAGTGATTNNKILRYDLENQNTWTVYNFGNNGMYERNQSLYFVGSSTGQVFIFGSADSDNGAGINAYWKSKDLFGTSPFVDKEFVNISCAAGMVANSSMTVTYTINGSSNSTYTMPLKIGNATFTKFNKNLPVGRTGTFFNLQFGNSAADQPWEMFGCQYGYRPKPWTVTVP